MPTPRANAQYAICGVGRRALWLRRNMQSAASSSSCGLSSGCLGLPNASRASNAVDESARGRYVALFEARPQDYFAHWGGATGLATKIISVAKRQASFGAVIDIGCNTGDWSRSWLGRDGGGGREKTGKLLCIEALPSLAKALKPKLSRFPGGDRTHVLHMAVSNVSGVQPIFGLPASRGKFARTQTGAGLSRAPTEAGQVQLGTVSVQTLDSVLRNWRMMESGRLFVKIDTEGFDVHVLLGAQCALRTGAIDGEPVPALPCPCQCIFGAHIRSLRRCVQSCRSNGTAANWPPRRRGASRCDASR